MLQWACQSVAGKNKDLLELYCGNAKSSVYAAQWNIQQNQINNIQVARLSAEEFTQAYNGEREFRRLQEAEIDIQGYDQNVDAATLSLPLWPNTATLAPSSEQYTLIKHGAIRHITSPQLRVYPPKQSNHIAVLVISGGGYAREELAKESTPTAQMAIICLHPFKMAKEPCVSFVIKHINSTLIHTKLVYWVSPQVDI
ncbi:unnamed protein product [Oppiella nova]|uniref:tRNA (uracil(54)-C(5))-methyltransferase n=1 Tax=Oppiella nova TaxID=334625 RepID=A0A7R9Q8K4_9ACAR|nr:unnamed protein product [Oppiella nova]CAG2157570.1 unnamed protein product [Oppiella nova]